MYKINAAGRQPLLCWLVSDVSDNRVKAVIYEPRGQQGTQTTEAAIALRSIVDSSVTSMQAKYKERAETIAGNFQAARSREVALEQVRSAFFEVAQDTPQLRDVWPRIEERVGENEMTPTILDADEALKQYHSMKTYLTTRHGVVAEQSEDMYEVNMHINMTRANTHTDRELTHRMHELVRLALRTFVSAPEMDVANTTNVAKDRAELCTGFNEALMARHVRQGSIHDGEFVEQHIKNIFNQVSPDSETTVTELVEAFVPVDNENISLLSLKDVGELDGGVIHPLMDESRKWMVPVAVRKVVLPAMMVGMERKPVTARLIDDVCNMLTSHDAFEARSVQQDMFSRVDTVARNAGGDGEKRARMKAEAAKVVAAVNGYFDHDDDNVGVSASFRDSDRRCAYKAVASPNVTSENIHVDALQAFQAAQQAELSWPTEYFRLTPAESAAGQADGIVEFDTAESWSAGHGPSDVCDALDGVMAFLHHKLQ